MHHAGVGVTEREDETLTCSDLDNFRCMLRSFCGSFKSENGERASCVKVAGLQIKVRVCCGMQLFDA